MNTDARSILKLLVAPIVMKSAAAAVIGMVILLPLHAEEPAGSGSQPPAAVSAVKAPTADSEKNAVPKPGPSGGQVQYVGPDTYILLDAEGHPQPMPGMTYEDFLAAWKKLNEAQASESRPGYAIENLTFTGRVIGQRAELECQVSVHLMEDGSVDVPLGLVGGILQSEPKFSAASGEADSKKEPATGTSDIGKQYLTADPERGGFVARFHGKSGENRSLVLHLLVPLAHDGPETSLPLSCPRAVASQLSLDIDTKISEARVNSGTLVSQDTNPQVGTTVKVAGPTGLFRLSWQTPAKDSPAITSVLNALGAIHVTVDGRGIRSDAHLTVRSYGGAFDQFRVRLPAGSQLIQARPDAARSPESQYRVRVENSVPPQGAEKGAPSQQIVVVELPEKQQGPVIIDLATEYAGSADKRNQDVDLAGFEVMGAIRQFGDVALTVADDWQARWELGSYVRQVDPNELDTSLQSFNPTAAFQYDRQPWSLKVRLARRQLRVHVTPKFDLECLPEEARLTVKLNYQVFGARAFEFRVELNGWETTGDPVESGSLVDSDRVTVTPEHTLLLPLVQAAARRAELTLTLRRALKREESRIKLPLPVPAADSIGTGELVVHAAPDVNLLPDIANSTGLTTASVPTIASENASDGATELHYRTLLPAATFVADRLNRAREVVAQRGTQIDIAENGAQVDQEFTYAVRFEPVSELTFDVPTEFFENADGVEALLATNNANGEAKPEDRGTPLRFSSTGDESNIANVSDRQQVRVLLPRPRTGKFTVRVRYHMAFSRTGAAEAHVVLPLIHANEGQAASGPVTVRTTRDLVAAIDDNAPGATWKLASSTAEVNAENAALHLVADHEATTIPLRISAARANPSASVMVERVWIQNWFSKDVVQNRAAFLIRTAGSQATIELPPDETAGDIEVLVNRQPAQIVSQAPGRLIVRLSEAANSTPVGAGSSAVTYAVELRSRQPYRPNLLTLHHLTPPQIEGSTALSQVYWQIVLPGDEHVAHPPAQLSAASEWQWLGAFWGRRPVWTQAELEAWVGASQQIAPTSSHNQYLFTGLLPIATIELITAPRWFIVLSASASVLALAMIGLYAPVARNPWVWSVAALLIVVAALIFPAETLLLAQASIVGILLAGLSYLVSRLSARPARLSTGSIVSPSSQRLVTPWVESIKMPPLVAAASTAPTTSLRLSDSE